MGGVYKTCMWTTNSYWYLSSSTVQKVLGSNPSWIPLFFSVDLFLALSTKKHYDRIRIDFYPELLHMLFLTFKLYDYGTIIFIGLTLYCHALTKAWQYSVLNSVMHSKDTMSIQYPGLSHMLFSTFKPYDYDTIPILSIQASLREIQVFTGGTKQVMLTTTTTDISGEFCVMLALGEYMVKVRPTTPALIKVYQIQIDCCWLNPKFILTTF